MCSSIIIFDYTYLGMSEAIEKTENPNPTNREGNCQYVTS